MAEEIKISPEVKVNKCIVTREEFSIVVLSAFIKNVWKNIAGSISLKIDNPGNNPLNRHL